MPDLLFNAFITFFVIVDPIGISTIFVSLTVGADAAMRRGLALRGTAIATAVLVVFAFIGDYLFRALGVTLPAFSIAGGVLLFLLAIDMVLVRRTGLSSTVRAEEQEAGHREDISVFPLAIPLIAGPGALTSVLIFMGRAEGDFVMQGAVLAVMLAVMAITLTCLMSATWITRLLGVTGVNVVGRVLGIILAALAVQLILDGIRKSGLVAGAAAGAPFLG